MRKKDITKKSMKHFNIVEFNRGKSLKRIRSLVDEDDIAYINKNDKQIAIVISNERYEKLLVESVDIMEY